MSNITVSNEEFADILMVLLFDAIREDTPLEANERYAEFIETLKQRNLKSILFRHYLDMGTETRVQFKRLKKSLGSSDSARITILGKGESEEEKQSIKKKLKSLLGLKEEIDSNFDRDLCKQIFRKVKDVRYKSGKPITEDVFDKIIDHCIEEKAKQLEVITEDEENG